jgi:hypothetical protein
MRSVALATQVSATFVGGPVGVEVVADAEQVEPERLDPPGPVDEVAGIELVADLDPETPLVDIAHQSQADLLQVLSQAERQALLASVVRADDTTRAATL